jgi:FAD/FMN-containing dehydrogenase
MAALTTADIEQLKLRFRGELITPYDSAYNEARTIWNGMIDRRPTLIARCIGTHDVIEAVKVAREQNLTVSIRGGGHNVAGNALVEGGLVIDLSHMRSVHVDKRKKVARVDAGCLWGDVDAETQRFGLAVSGGIVSHTGVAGLTLGGGFGWISRKHGLSVDNLMAADVVLADGTAVTASEKEHPDLFWAIRGGGGNFGVVTSFLFECARVGTDVFSGVIVHPFDNAKEFLRFYREYAATLPDEMTVWAVIRHAPPLPFLPQKAHGRLAIIVPFVYLGKQTPGKKLVQPVRTFGKMVGEHMGMTPYTEWQSGFDALNAHGARNYWKSHHLDALSDDVIDAFIEAAQTFPTQDCEILTVQMGGAASRIPAETTAYAQRTPPFIMNIHSRWSNAGDDARCMNWARALWERCKPHARGVYVNFLSDGENRVQDAYPPATWKRLVTVKRTYDPDNFFRINQNIAP